MLLDKETLFDFTAQHLSAENQRECDFCKSHAERCKGCDPVVTRIVQRQAIVEREQGDHKQRKHEGVEGISIPLLVMTAVSNVTTLNAPAAQGIT